MAKQLIAGILCFAFMVSCAALLAMQKQAALAGEADKAASLAVLGIVSLITAIYMAVIATKTRYDNN